MKRSLALLLAVFGLLFGTVTSASAVPAGHAATAVAASLPSEPNAFNQTDYVGVQPTKPNPNGPAHQWTASYFSAGVRQNLDANGEFYAFCGDQWKENETLKAGAPLFPATVTVSQQGQIDGVHVRVNADRTVVTYYGNAQKFGC